MHVREAHWQAVPEPRLQRPVPLTQAQHEPHPLPSWLRPRNPQRDRVLQQVRALPKRHAGFILQRMRRDAKQRGDPDETKTKRERLEAEWDAYIDECIKSVDLVLDTTV